MDQGAKFVIETLRKAVKLSEEKAELKPLIGKVKNQYNFVKDAKKTGDLYEHFLKFEGDVHKDAEKFKVFEEHGLTTFERFAEVLRRRFPHELDNKTSPNDFIVGESYKNNDLRYGFKVTYMGGIRISTKTNTVVLIAKRFDDRLNIGWVQDTFHYTGQEQDPDEPFKKGNKAIMKAKEMNRELHLFEMMEEKSYTYRGKVFLSDKPYYKDTESGLGEPTRPVFPLKLKY